MRLWSIHPKYLDSSGLVALWRESLLAKKVLNGKTKGYKSHPQLVRFRNHPKPLKAIADYLTEVWRESQRRGFDFDKKKIGPRNSVNKMTVTRGQLEYEFDLLCHKTKKRSPDRCRELLSTKKIEPHPLFRVITGDTEKWEKVKTSPTYR